MLLSVLLLCSVLLDHLQQLEFYSFNGMANNIFLHYILMSYHYQGNINHTFAVFGSINTEIVWFCRTLSGFQIAVILSRIFNGWIVLEKPTLILFLTSHLTCTSIFNVVSIRTWNRMPSYTFLAITL